MYLYKRRNTYYRPVPLLYNRDAWLRSRDGKEKKNNNNKKKIAKSSSTMVYE